MEIDPEHTWRVLLHDREQTLLTMASLQRAAVISEPPHALGLLIENHPEHLRQLFEWALERPAEITADRLSRTTSLPHFVIQMLGEVGNRSTAARLHVHTSDPETGDTAVNAIKRINNRIAP